MNSLDVALVNGALFLYEAGNVHGKLNMRLMRGSDGKWY